MCENNEDQSKHIARKVVEPILLTKELSDAIDAASPILPIFERAVHDIAYIRHYSLNNNEYLKCNWQKYKDNYGTRVLSPIFFPDVRDQHFYNCDSRLRPDQSVHRKVDHCLKLLKPGPGLDQYGERLIPLDLTMKRGTGKKERPKPLVRKTKPNLKKKLQQINGPCSCNNN